MLFLTFLFFYPQDGAFLDQVKQAPAEQRDHLIQSKVKTTGTPLVEGRKLLFLARSRNGKSPRLISEHNMGASRFDPATSGQAMIPIEGSQWAYLKAELVDKARIEYQLFYGESAELDPHNPASLESFGRLVSEFLMPGYATHPELETQPTLNRDLMEETQFDSQALANSRSLHIYLPPGYFRSQDRYPVVYFNDGTSYVKEAEVPRVLDYLITRALMSPVIAVFVDPVKRGEEYRMNPKFREMMTREILTLIDTNYRTIANRRGRLVVGGSRGGLAAMDLVSHHPDLFSMCAPLAPALNPMPAFDALRKTQLPSVSFFVLGCLYDQRFLPDAHALAKELKQKGWPVVYKEIPEGHNVTAWKRRIDEILIHFFN